MALLLLAAWGSLGPGRRPATAPACTCALERARNGWCEACVVGYVAEQPIRSKTLYDALDAHGHDVDLSSFACADCRAAADADGYCERHERGFVGGRAYLSRLAYHLARGQPEAVQAELRLVALAVETTERCELCAAALVIDGDCPACRLSYRDGQARPLR
jgi:hypothetical protein